MRRGYFASPSLAFLYVFAQGSELQMQANKDENTGEELTEAKAVLPPFSSSFYSNNKRRTQANGMLAEPFNTPPIPASTAGIRRFVYIKALFMCKHQRLGLDDVDRVMNNSI